MNEAEVHQYGVIVRRISSKTAIHEWRVALPPVVSAAHFAANTESADVTRSQLVIAVYRLAGKVKDDYYYDFVGVEVK